jgi:hypothetical protein
VEQTATANRKRKRRVIVQPLDAQPAGVKEDGVQEKMAATSTTDQLDVRKPRRLAKTELICPIRLDVDLDGVRFQDTFLVNACVLDCPVAWEDMPADVLLCGFPVARALSTCSPETIAAHIAQDEKMSDKLKVRF